MEVPHVVILTFPAQGHVKPLLMLAELLSHAGFQVTFVTTDHNHDRLRRCTDDSAVQPRGSLRFMSIPDGLPPEHPRSGLQILDMLLTMGTLMKPKFKELVDSISRETAGRWSPPTCIIADGLIAFAVEAAEELEIPIISFRTYSASCTWANFHIPTLIEQGEIPLSDSYDAVMLILENLLSSDLVNSGKAFLWVIRSDLIGEEDRVHETPQELLVGTKERGCIVDWAPQEEVLAHRAVGGFLTHSGWNSTIESISAGVPMVCWPHFADQQVNSRCVSDMWKIGVDMKDTCDRSTVEKMVRDIMEDVRGEFLKSTAEIARMAHDSVMESGSSQSNLEKLIEDIKSINLARCSSGSNK